MDGVVPEERDHRGPAYVSAAAHRAAAGRAASATIGDRGRDLLPAVEGSVIRQRPGTQRGRRHPAARLTRTGGTPRGAREGGAALPEPPEKRSEVGDEQ